MSELVNECSVSLIESEDPNVKKAFLTFRCGGACYEIPLQSGAVPEHGVNGVSIEALILASIMRLKAWQTQSFPCRENAIAITKLEEALMWLGKRTDDRIERGVEGKEEA